MAFPPLRSERTPAQQRPSQQRPSQQRPSQQRVVQGATLLAGVSLVLVLVNIVLASLNQNLQEDVNRRQQVLVQAAQINTITTLLERAMVQQAQQGNAKIEAVLKRADVSFTPPASATAATPPQATPPQATPAPGHTPAPATPAPAAKP